MCETEESQRSYRQGEHEDTSANTRVLGVKLIQAVKEKRLNIAYKLIEDGADVTHADRAGWQALHYAACLHHTEGYVEMIIHLIKHGASSNCFDSNGETPLHKAARRGEVLSLLTLLTHGAEIDTMNWKGQSALELGIIARNVDVIETLMMLGADPKLQDWTWTINEKLTNKEEDILRLIQKQSSMIPGFKLGAIKFDLAYILPNSSFKFKQPNVTVDASGIEVPFFMYCCKMQSEYAELDDWITEDTKLFSDIYICRTWCLKSKSIKLKITIKGVPLLDEYLSLVSPSQNKGQLMRVDKMDNKNKTMVTIVIPVSSNSTITFGLAVEKIKETFTINEGASVLKPTAEPEAAISIPENTFKGTNELTLQIANTKDVNDDMSDTSAPLLLTNVIDLSVTNGQQPKNPIEMTLPVHLDDIGMDEMCILASSEEDPDSDDCWEIIPANSNKGGTHTIFNIEHFSIYAGTRMKMVLEDKANVIHAIMQSIKHQRKVDFLVLTRLVDDHGYFEALVECTLSSKTRKRAKYWEKRGYTMQDVSDGDHIIYEQQSFKLSLSGNLQELSGEENLKLDFDGRRGSKHVLLSIAVRDADCVSDGKLSIDMEEKVELENPIEIVKSGCFPKKNKIRPTEKKVYSVFKPYITVPIVVVLPKPLEDALDISTFPDDEDHDDCSNLDTMMPTVSESVDNKQHSVETTKDDSSKRKGGQKTIHPMKSFAKDLEKSNRSTVSGMKARKLIKIADQLTEKEGIHLGYQLLPAADANMIAQRFKENIAARVLVKYRGKRPHQHQVKKIQKALRAVNRPDLALQFAK